MSMRCAVLGLMGIVLLGQGPTSMPAPGNQELVRKVDPARVEILPKGRVKIPSMGPREKKQIAYAFKNISATPISLRILDLSPGVTVEGQVLQQPIAAGASAVLTMTIDATEWLGVQRRNVRLTTDDPKQGEYLLPIEIVVRPDLTVDAERKGFGEVGSFESPELCFLFTRETGDPTKIHLTSSLPDYLESEFEFVKNTTTLKLFLRPEKILPGVNLGLETLKVETNAPHQPEFSLYVDWILKRTVEASPTRVVFLNPSPKETVLRLKRRDGKSFSVENFKVEGEGFTVSPATEGSAKHHELRVQRKATQDAKAMLILRFVGEEELLKVPLAFLPSK